MSLLHDLNAITKNISLINLNIINTPKKKIIIKKIEENKEINTEAKKIKKTDVKKDKKTDIKKKKKTDVKKIIKKVINKKNEFIKEGQIKETPLETDGLRLFYTSLLKQNKNSAMAIKWCKEHGLFPDQTDNITLIFSKLKLK